MTIYVPIADAGPLRADSLGTDASLCAGADSLANLIHTDAASWCAAFCRAVETRYVLDRAMARNWPIRLVTHPRSTRTCYEKAALLGDWSPLNTIKAVYFEHEPSGQLYAVVVPETGCFLDRAAVASALGVADAAALSKARSLPRGMSPGTCSPFIHPADADPQGGRVSRILFDRQTVAYKTRERHYDDFSFGDHTQWSLQINYAHAFALLREQFGDLVGEADVLPLKFSERFIRRQGNIRIEYQFQSLDYRTAQFIESTHGQGDLQVENDMADELFVQEIHTLSRQDWMI